MSGTSSFGLDTNVLKQVMEIGELGQKIKDIVISEKTKNIYDYPFSYNTNVKRIDKGGLSHNGSYKGAIDIIVDLGTPVIAPADGVVFEVVDSNEKYGSTEDYKNYLNYITILHDNGEYSQLAHLAKNSSLVKKGDFIVNGRKLAVTGNSGWMDEPHLHMFVFRKSDNKDGFKGLQIRFKDK